MKTILILFAIAFVSCSKQEQAIQEPASHIDSLVAEIPKSTMTDSARLALIANPTPDGKKSKEMSKHIGPWTDRCNLIEIVSAHSSDPYNRGLNAVASKGVVIDRTLKTVTLATWCDNPAHYYGTENFWKDWAASLKKQEDERKSIYTDTLLILKKTKDKVREKQ